MQIDLTSDWAKYCSLTETSISDGMQLALICILLQEAYVKKFIASQALLHMYDVYSNTKLNTPVLVQSLQLSNFGLTHVTVYFSVIIDL